MPTGKIRLTWSSFVLELPVALARRAQLRLVIGRFAARGAITAIAPAYAETARSAATLDEGKARFRENWNMSRR